MLKLRDLLINPIDVFYMKSERQCLHKKCKMSKKTMSIQESLTRYKIVYCVNNINFSCGMIYELLLLLHNY